MHSLVVSKPTPHYVAPPSTSQGGTRPAFGLDRIRSLLRAMGRPDRALRFVHIAGTSGKTSTATLIEAILRAHDRRTGLHISPHMSSLTERFTVDGAPCTEAEVTALVEEVKETLDGEYRRGKMGAPSYFELVLALALRHFARARVDWTVLEAGLGGRYDGTNVIDAAVVSVITCIGLDHTNVLGNTRAAIAQDKVGIVKRGGRLITAEADPKLLKLFDAEARRQECAFEILGRDFEVEVRRGAGGLELDYRAGGRRLESLRMPPTAAFQGRNAGLALRAAQRALESEGRELDEGACREALAEARVPGRFELLSSAPLALLDGAHNPQKMQLLATELQLSWPGRRFEVVYAATSGRDLEAIMTALARVARRVHITRPMAAFRVGEEPSELKALLARLAPDVPGEVYLDPHDAWDAACEARSGEDGLLVTGSLYLISYLRPRLTS